MLGWITTLLRGIWAVSRGSWVDVGNGLRPGSGASALYLFLFLLFCLIGGVLLLLGFDLGRVDAWLDAQGSVFELAGTIAFKAMLGLILLISVLVGAAGLYGRLSALLGLRRRDPLGRRARARAPRNSSAEADGLGWGAIFVALITGYFSAVGLFH